MEQVTHLNSLHPASSAKSLDQSYMYLRYDWEFKPPNWAGGSRYLSSHPVLFIIFSFVLLIPEPS